MLLLERLPSAEQVTDEVTLPDHEAPVEEFRVFLEQNIRIGAGPQVGGITPVSRASKAPV